MRAATNQPLATKRTVAGADRAYPWYIAAALIIAVAGGFLLALLLPIAAAEGWTWGARWRALAQAHGHLQVVGWLGLFIVGMGLRLVPRFAGRPLAAPGVTIPVLVLLLVGLVGRAVAQPWLDAPGSRAVLVAAAVAELAATLLFAVAVIGTLNPVKTTLPAAPLLMLGAAGFVAQAAFAAAWLPGLTAESPALTPARNAVLLSLQVHAFLLPFVLGVALRALPVFFAQPPPSPRRTWGLAVALACGALLHALAPVLAGGATGRRLEGAGAIVVAAVILAALFNTHAWRRASRLRPATRPTALLIQGACAWLALAAVALLVTGGTALIADRVTPSHEIDAIRHAILLGGFSTLLMGMARLLLPWLAGRRQSGSAARREALLLFGLLTGATVSRVAGALLEGWGVGAPRFRLMAAGGLLAIVAVSLFAGIIAAAARHARAAIALEVRPP